MAVNEHEEAFVRSFIVKDRRERYLSLLANPKRRPKLLDRLNHQLDLDYAFATPIPTRQRNVGDLEHLLRQKGAGAMCHVIADASPLDGADLLLHDALERLYGLHQFGVVFCCVAGRLAFYKPEDVSEHYLWSVHADCVVAALAAAPPSFS